MKSWYRLMQDVGYGVKIAVQPEQGREKERAEVGSAEANGEERLRI